MPTRTSVFRIIYSLIRRAWVRIPVARGRYNMRIRYDCVHCTTHTRIHIRTRICVCMIHTIAVLEIEIQLSAVPVTTWWNVGITPVVREARIAIWFAQTATLFSVRLFALVPATVPRLRRIKTGAHVRFRFSSSH